MSHISTISKPEKNRCSPRVILGLCTFHSTSPNISHKQHVNVIVLVNLKHLGAKKLVEACTNCIRLDRQVASLFPQFTNTWAEVRCLKIIVASIYTEAARSHPFP